jgi:hypothetical protein
MKGRAEAWVGWALVAATLTLSLPSSAGEETPAADTGAGDDIVKDAKVRFNKGVAYFNQENWEQALREFQKSFAITPHWKIRYNIGLCYLKLEFWAQAITEMTLMIEEGGANVPPKQLGQVKKMIASLEPKVGTLTLKGELEGVEVDVDGKPIIGLAEGGVLFLNPGEHRVEVTLGDTLVISEDVALTGGQEKVLEVTVPEQNLITVKEKPRPKPEAGKEPMAEPPTKKPRSLALSTPMIVGIALASAAGAVLVGWGGAGIHAILEQKKQTKAYNDYMDGKTTDREAAIDDITRHYDRARASALAATILLSIGGALAAGSIVAFIYPKLRKEKPAASSGLRLVPAWSPGWLGLSGTF